MADHLVARRAVIKSAGLGLGAGLASGVAPALAKAPRRKPRRLKSGARNTGRTRAT